MNRSHEHIPGWGVDLDRRDRPAVPMERKPPRLQGVHWDEPVPQQSNVEVLTSTEHMRRPPVYGTSVPPRGLSGRIRRRAFRHSENDLRHWLMLLFADRVDAVESAVGDGARSPQVRTATSLGIAVAAVWILGRLTR
ncbi:hypothetical protein [Dyella sp.]|jgi:hypothetical protein|uniref:hypothetical protein n=1 Tax=Dyella sp. TaxID=1869338 RepID=UPI002D778254|nr:hypothetical protein [Dyella sp.]HET6433428.1 hypothetical protein [Dyella sp.]